MTTDRVPPRVENAPGLVWKPRAQGWEARWYARADLVKRGYEPKSHHLWYGVATELTEIDTARISDECCRLQAEMLIWGRGGIPTIATFDGTLASLIGCYQSDPDSPYRKLRYFTRQNYDSLCRCIARDYADVPLSDIKARTVRHWHETWKATGHIAMAHSQVGMLRTLFGFGATILEDEECERLCGVLHKMRFEMSKARDEQLTAGQASDVRAVSRPKVPSIALAQAFQFECTLRQKDVIGEWVPTSEPGVSDVIHGDINKPFKKWLRGLRWEEINDALILSHITSKRQKPVEVDLRLAPMVLEEFKLQFGFDLAAGLDRSKLPANGPIIKDEETGRPYSTAGVFRRRWRKFATAVGIPVAVKNMDSRAGAITEATDADASLEDIRHAATHSDIATTQRYSRAAAKKTAAVMQLRVAHRNKK